MEEIHDLHQRLLGLVFTGHVGKGHAGLLLDVNLGVALSNAHDAASAAHTAEHHIQQSDHQHRRQHPPNDEIDDAGAGAGVLSLEAHTAFQKPVRQFQILDPDRIILDQPGILGGAALWHDHQPAARLPDRLHLSVLDHPDKLVIADLLALALFQGRVHHADHRQRDAQDDHHDPDPRASRPLSIISVLIVVIHSVFLHFFYNYILRTWHPDT